MGIKSVAHLAVLLAISLYAIPVHADGWDANSKASNIGGIVNTRHNMTVSYDTDPNVANMDFARNNYGEVCVYCHTPHGSNSTVDAPLWNRTNLNYYTGSFLDGAMQSNVYDSPLQSGQTPTTPGVSSLTCLSCHDGVTAVDSVINMPNNSMSTPGYGGSYLATQELGPNDAFLDSWNANQYSDTNNHSGLTGLGQTGFTSPIILVYNTGCSTCHAPRLPSDGWYGIIPDFRPFVIGTDLRDDHPVGVQLPNTAVYDFNPTTGTNGLLKFYDTNGNSKPNINEIRFYDTGEGFEVECASCHDPHGVPSAGPGTILISSFLRVDNAGSKLCLTCHAK